MEFRVSHKINSISILKNCSQFQKNHICQKMFRIPTVFHMLWKIFHIFKITYLFMKSLNIAGTLLKFRILLKNQQLWKSEHLYKHFLKPEQNFEVLTSFKKCVCDIFKKMCVQCKNMFAWCKKMSHNLNRIYVACPWKKCMQI